MIQALSKMLGYYVQSYDLPNCNPDELTAMGFTDLAIHVSRKPESQYYYKTFIADIVKQLNGKMGIWLWLSANIDFDDTLVDLGTDKGAKYVTRLASDIADMTSLAVVKGVVLDIDNGDKTKSVRLTTDMIKTVRTSCKKYLLLSLMSYYFDDPLYYGQDYEKLAPYCDGFLPMIYRGNYNRTPEDCGLAVKACLLHAPNKIIACLQTYDSDQRLEQAIKLGKGDTEIYTDAEMQKDYSIVTGSGSDGCFLFERNYSKFKGVKQMATGYSFATIEDGAKRVKAWMEANSYALPKYVTLDGKQVDMANFMYLLMGAIVTRKAVTPIATESAIATTVTFKEGQIKYADYIKVATNVKNFISNNKQAPSYATTPLGKMPFKDLVYNFSKILAFMYANNTAYPNYVSCKQIGVSTDIGDKPSTATDHWSRIEKAYGKTIANIEEMTAVVRKYLSYFYYYNDQKTLEEEVASFINAILGLNTGNNCVDYAQVLYHLAKEKGYGAEIWAFWCRGDGCWHVVCRIWGNEYAGRTCKIMGKTYKGVILDWAKIASEGTATGTYWCNPNNAQLWPGFAPKE